MSHINNTQEHKTSGINYYQAAIAVLLGFFSSVNPATISLVWLFVVCACLYGLLNRKMEYVWYAIAASPFIEVWGRMVKHAPLVPMEMGKYFVAFAIIIIFADQIVRNKETRVFNAGLFIVLFLLPSLLVSLSDFDREQWVFNVMSILEMATLLIIVAKERWDIERFCKTLQFGVVPIIAILVFLTIRTPDYAEINFALGANKEASGGFGSNQVATILGLGIVFTTLLIILKRPLFSLTWLNYALLGYLLFRGFLTFSRGGMVGAVLAIFVALMPIMFTSVRAFARNMMIFIVLGFLGFFIFSKVNDITGNQLLLRYEGETKGSYSGNRNKTINSATSGREVILLADVGIFQDNFLFGVGPGGAKELRAEYGAEEATAAHIEFSRLLSEHGLGGLGVILVVVLFPVIWIRKQRIGIWKGVSSGLFTIAIFTSMHSAMRTNTTVVCYALAAVPVLMNKRWMEQLKYNN